MLDVAEDQMMMAFVGKAGTRRSVPGVNVTPRKPAAEPIQPPSGRAVSVPTGKFYSTAFEMRLNPADLGKSRSVHFNRANAALDRAIQSAPAFAALMEEMIPGVGKSVSSAGGRTSPPGWVWHHAQEAGVMHLVPEAQHTPGSKFWDTVHPGGAAAIQLGRFQPGAPKN